MFPLDNLTEHFMCSGSVAGLNIALLNSFSESDLELQTADGYVDSVRFEFSANDVESNGKMVITYRDLKVSFNGSPDLKKRIVSGIANALIKNNNPAPNGKLVVGTIHYKRNPYRYFPFYICRSIISGVPSSVGLPVTISHD
jgi:hypothetical protein